MLSVAVNQTSLHACTTKQFRVTLLTAALGAACHVYPSGPPSGTATPPEILQLCLWHCRRVRGCGHHPTAAPPPDRRALSSELREVRPSCGSHRPSRASRVRVEHEARPLQTQWLECPRVSRSA